MVSPTAPEQDKCHLAASDEMASHCTCKRGQHVTAQSLLYQEARMRAYLASDMAGSGRHGCGWTGKTAI